MPCRDVSGNVACPCDRVKVEILGEAREARAVHIRVVLGFYCASLDRIWIIEIVGKGLERSTSEGIENKWGTPLRVVTPPPLSPQGRPDLHAFFLGYWRFFTN